MSATMIHARKALYHILENGPDTMFSGLCGNVYWRIVDESNINSQELDNMFDRMFKSWDKFSGHPDYPVEGCAGVYFSIGDKYNRATLYGRLRYELIHHLIKCIDEELMELEHEKADA